MKREEERRRQEEERRRREEEERRREEEERQRQQEELERKRQEEITRRQKAEDKRRQQEALRRIQQEQLANMQVHSSYKMLNGLQDTHRRLPIGQGRYRVRSLQRLVNVVARYLAMLEHVSMELCFVSNRYDGNEDKDVDLFMVFLIMYSILDVDICWDVPFHFSFHRLLSGHRMRVVTAAGCRPIQLCRSQRFRTWRRCSNARRRRR